jgi:hypothetical protein
MGIWTASWPPGLFVEAQKFWLYSISFGIMIGFVQWYKLYMTPSILILPAEKDEKTEDKEGEEESKKATQEAKANVERRGKIMKGIVINLCDLSIPGAITGWVPVWGANVGWLSAVSTLLGSGDIWARIQGE